METSLRVPEDEVWDLFIETIPSYGDYGSSYYFEQGIRLAERRLIPIIKNLEKQLKSKTDE